MLDLQARARQIGWSPRAVRVMLWRERSDIHKPQLPPWTSRDLVSALDAYAPRHWVNAAGEIDLDTVAMVTLLDTMPCGHWAVVVTLSTNPIKEIIVDGTLDDWWYRNDPVVKKRLDANVR